MKPTTLTIFELFEKERRYIVPLFQRPYVWSMDSQWEPLWEDVIKKAEQLLDAKNSQTTLEENHFLGATVLNQVKTYGRQVAAMEIIDGQQRLTTLQIFLIALRDFVKPFCDSYLDSTTRRLTQNDCRMEEDFEQYKVWPTNSDRKVFEDIFHAGSPTNLENIYPLIHKPRKRDPEPRPKLVEAYLYFYNAIKDFTKEPNEIWAEKVSSEKLEALIETITKKLELVIIELEEKDNPQIIFETLNARGEPLLASDLIRNFVFFEAKKRNENIKQLYEDYWRKFDEPFDGPPGFWKVLERQGRLERPRLDLFIFHYLTYITERDISITSLFQEFRGLWNTRSNQISLVEEALKELNHYSEIFHEFFTATEQTRLGIFINRLRIIDTSTVYPLLLFLFGEIREKVHKSEIEGILSDLESYLIRRLVCQLTHKNYNRVFLSLLKNLRKSNHVTRQEIQSNLLELRGDAARWPDDEEFRRCWLNYPVYEMLRENRVRTILEAIDLQMETNKQEKIYINDKLSIEHIRPRRALPNNDWQPIENEQIIHTFGNLTLLTHALNASVSNGPFSKKRSAIAKQSRLRMNVYFQDLDDSLVWDKSKIMERGEMLFEIARLVWERPDER